MPHLGLGEADAAPVASGPPASTWAEAVSYTHLDVYKRQPPVLGAISKRQTPWVAIIFTTLIAAALIWFADLQALGGTTAFLLLIVFTVVNISVLVLRKDKVEHAHFRAPTVVPVLGGLSAAFLASPLSGRAAQDFIIGGWLLVIGIVLSGLTYLLNRRMRRDPVMALENLDELGGHPDELRKQREGRPYT